MGEYLTALVLDWEYPPRPVSGYPLGASLDEVGKYFGFVPRTQLEYRGEDKAYNDSKRQAGGHKKGTAAKHYGLAAERK